MKVLITGANGLLGQYLVKLLLRKKYTVIATGRGASRLPLEGHTRYKYYSLDITEDQSLHDVIATVKPECIIHAAAMTQVDDCEIKKEEAFKINVSGTLKLMGFAEEYSQHFIFISTDFVFDGKKGNYTEDELTEPISWYGFTKMQAEQFVHHCKIPSTIVRTCLVYGNSIPGGRRNIITWVKDQLEKKERIKVVDDQWRTPTWAGDLANGISLVIEKKALGIFHISGKDLLTPYQMALKTADFFSLDKSLIERVNATTFTQPALRPPKTGFVIEKARMKLGYEPLSFAEGLKQMAVESSS